MQTSGLRGAATARRRRSVLATAAFSLAFAGVVAPVREPSVSAQTLTCSSGTAVPNPTNNSSLVADCETLLDLKSTLAGSGRLNWSASRAMTGWTGITMSGGRVTELRLSGLGLTGTIPTELGSLSGLTTIYMASNSLSGSIPASIGNLTNLRHLNLARNELRRPLPSQLGNLSNLETLVLTSNFFLETLPTSFGNLTNLRSLDLSGTKLLGHIPSQLGNLSNLTELHLAGNQHFGTIPSQLGNLSNLKELYLTGNGLSGSIPASLGNLTNLTSLQVNLNELTGDFPVELENLVKLEELRLADNVLTGCVPGSLSYVSRNDIAQLGLPYCRAKPIFRTSESGLRSISEGATVGTAVGRPVAAADRDGDRLTYSLGGTDAGNFQIDASSGQLRVAAALDREAQETHSLTVSVHDGTDRDGEPDTSTDTTIDVTVTILDVDEEPTVTGPATATTTENADTVLGYYFAVDPEGNEITWTVAGVDRQAYEIDSRGALRFAVPPDYESPTDRGRDNSYDLLVQASDGSNTVSLTVAVFVTGIEEAPVLFGPRVVSLSENSSGELGRYRAIDPEDATVTLTLVGRDSGSLDLGDDGVLSIASAPDFEQPGDADRDGVYEVSIEASDGTLTTSRAVRIGVRDVNEAPAVSGDTSIERDELYTDDTSIIGRFYADDPESGDVQWKVAGSDGADFTIDPFGQLRFAETPNFESPADANRDNVYSVAVEAFDGVHTGSLAATISVSNVDESPELRPFGLYPQVGNSLYLSLNDPDGSVTGTQWSWQRSSNRVSWSTISDATSSSYYLTSDDLGRYLRVNVSYSDGEGENKTQPFTWNSAVRAEPSSNTDPYFDSTVAAQRSVRETDPAGYAVGLPFSADDDEGDPLVYSLSGLSNSSFRIDAATGQIRTHAPLDGYPGHTYRLTVNAADPSGATAQRPVNITVEDHPQAPVLTGPHVVHINEDTAGVAWYSARDPDGSQISWSLGGPDQHDLQISAHGELRFRQFPDANAPADANLDNTYEVDVQAFDGSFTVSQGVRITVADLDEPGTVTLSSTQPTLGSVLTASLSDPDGDITNLSWEWQRRRSGGEWTPIPDTDSSTYTVTRSDSGYTLRAEAVYDDDHGPVKSATSSGGSSMRSITSNDNGTNSHTTGNSRVNATGGGGGEGGGGVDGVEGTTLFVANGWSPADVGVSAAFAARTKGAAVAYTHDDELPSAVEALLDVRTVHLIVFVGGETAISPAVLASLAKAEPFADIKRITGSSRVDTAARAARLALDGAREQNAVIIVANGWSPPDIGVAATLAARLPYSAVVYTEASELPAESRQLIADKAPRSVLVVGGTAAVSQAVTDEIREVAPSASLKRISGPERTHTAQLAAQYLDETSAPVAAGERVVIVASGWSPPDIGVAAALSARTPGALVVYTAPGMLPAETEELLRLVQPGLVRIIGGTDAIPITVQNEIAALLPSGGRTQRTSGQTRIHTAVNVARGILLRD
ncbi:cadherin domain-containing protein [Candidatus Poriferisodalis sp.]|uniref:cadherin domain-containing protein n=1 Tax=Candidatus Poriferisodalis sp. TaxID=3101277 RepID=UPI003B51FD6D